MTNPDDIAIESMVPHSAPYENCIQQVEEKIETIRLDSDPQHELHGTTPSETIVTMGEKLASTSPSESNQLTQISDKLRSIEADVKKMMALLSPSSPRLVNHSTEESSRVAFEQTSYQDILLGSPSKIPVFSGKPTERARHFLLSIEQYTRTVYHWPQDILLRLISQYLTDKALDWYFYRLESERKFTSWHEFTVHFLAHFLCPVRLAQREGEWNDCIQQDGENINDFVVRLGSLWLDLRPKENETNLVKHLFCKMRSDLFGLMRFSLSSSLESTLADASHAEAILFERQQIRLTNDGNERLSACPDNHVRYSAQSNAPWNRAPNHRRRARASQRLLHSSSRYSYNETDCDPHHNGNQDPPAYHQQFYN